MDTTVLAFLPVLALFAFFVFALFRRPKCPDCGDPLPAFYRPAQKTRRMWRAGGYLCPRCGCETDAAGAKVTAATPRPPFPVRHWVAAGAAGAVAVGLAVALSSSGAKLPATAAVQLPPPIAEE